MQTVYSVYQHNVREGISHDSQATKQIHPLGKKKVVSYLKHSKPVALTGLVKRVHNNLTIDSLKQPFCKAVLFTCTFSVAVLSKRYIQWPTIYVGNFVIPYWLEALGLTTVSGFGLSKVIKHKLLADVVIALTSGYLYGSAVTQGNPSVVYSDSLLTWTILSGGIKEFLSQIFFDQLGLLYATRDKTSNSKVEYLDGIIDESNYIK